MTKMKKIYNIKDGKEDRSTIDKDCGTAEQ
jgi:hypothetical protein